MARNDPSRGPNADIAYITKHPGKYAITAWPGVGVRSPYVMVEVDDGGVIHQLTPEGIRDGVLAPDGWHPGVRCYIVGESASVFIRVPSGE